MSKRKVFLTLAPVFLLLFMGDALLTSYYALYFIENGLTEFEQSLLLFMIPFSLFAGCFALSPLAKNPKRTIWLFRICAMIEAALALSLAFCNSFIPLLIVIALISFCNGAPFTFLESLSSVITGKNGVAYANIRMFGTLGYIISLGLGGVILRFMPIKDAYFFASALLFLTFPASFLISMKNFEKVEEEVEEKQTGLKMANFKKAAVLLIALTLFYGAFIGSSYILPVRLKTLGLPDADYSLIRALGIGVEFMFLLLIPLFDRFFKDRRIPLIISASLILVSALLAVFVQDPYGLAFSNLVVSSAGKAFLFAYQAKLFEEKVGKRSLGAILTFTNGTVNAVAGLLNLSSSTIYTNLSFGWFFAIIVILEAAGLALLFFVKKTKAEEI